MNVKAIVTCIVESDETVLESLKIKLIEDVKVRFDPKQDSWKIKGINALKYWKLRKIDIKWDNQSSGLLE